MDVKIADSWKKELQSEFEKPYFAELAKFVHDQYLSKTIYPPPRQVFSAFDWCRFEDVKVVILGQDPYHGPGQANGLCFSVGDDVAIPPSLQNIYKEIESDLGKKVPPSGNLERWARQGVLLLNATLTVEARKPGSHQNKGWEQFTDSVIKLLSEKKENLVFLLWGAYAQAKGAMINESKHCVLKAPHPSPFSVYRGFFGCKHFSKANAFLKSIGKKEIDW